MDPHVPFKHRRTTLERAEKFISTHHFTDVNLRSRLYPEKVPVTSIHHFAAPDRVPFEQAKDGTYKPVKVGQTFGPTWSTHWFRLDVVVPERWVGQEVRLIWNSHSEALIWVDGQPRQGLSGEKNRLDYVLSLKQEKSCLRHEIYVEMACNGLFGAGEHLIQAPDPNKQFTLECVDIATFDRDVYSLILDMEILHGMAKELPEADRGFQALYAANDFVTACTVTDKSTYKRAHEIAEKFFSQRNGDTQHTVHAMGHAHMDTAWLWPYAETMRKCAQQYAWVKEQYPSLYQDICKFVKLGQFIPVGGTWVEMDGYVPSGEAFVRQFLYGQRFFQQEFGFWLPDTFGYASQLPQIMKQCGINRFLTQKLSWNLVNKFPHHTFWWEGLDGSKVLAHFPPGDNYCMEGQVKEHHTFWWEGLDGSQVLSHFPPGDSYHMEATVKEVLYTLSNFRDKGRSSRSVFLFGYGDGGNGPDEHMLGRLKRMEDIDGLPRVKMSTPDEFFTAVEQEDVGKLCTWRGELYLEMHNGTYTTHAKVKERNRRCEFLLQEAEQLWAVAVGLSLQAAGREGDAGSGGVYPGKALERLWKLLLLNQFHDVLPGSSINMVYHDAHRLYTEIETEGFQLMEKSMPLLASALNVGESKGERTPLVVNTLSWERTAVVPLPASHTEQPSKRRKTQGQTDKQGSTLAMLKVPSCSAGSLDSCMVDVDKGAEGSTILLSNSYLEAKIDSMGRLISLCSAGSPRELIKSGCSGNQFLLYDDVPLFWDAWDVMDYHLETSIEVVLSISSTSVIRQTIQLDAGCPYIKFHTQVEWHENRKFLKVEFPTNLHAFEATYEVQYGALQRPNHYNTSWDSAKFEVCGQKWMDISEHGAGFAVLTDSKYGYSAVGGILRVSLLRAPKAPDPEADMGTHQFSYAVMPHRGSWQEAGVVQAAFELNRPLRVSSVEQTVSRVTPRSFFWLDSYQVILDTVKMSEDNPASVMVVRLYEAFGGQVETTLSTCLPVRSAQRCSCLEEATEEEHLPIIVEQGVVSVPVKLRPFQIQTLLLTF
ncbi:hypothetical protein BaRGS_00015596 [Batillaria attramentaria]|uniref:alpha-mannosidase n=1 Tax=Batillaria attramentaria TaxID=370345 RepID=A0ABD0L1T0_9CAEN